MEEQFINAFKEALEIEDKEISLNDQFREYDEWDSLGQLSLIAMLDENYSVVIENNDFEKIVTVGDLLNEINKRAK
ncbi:acyl carrier protein [Rapidithrix thailandica]|uniref:Acyl carrier protein n=1 Tax=Rapidithrix thailandica TaxID=413964 RepID=A0AAW9SDN6_9BACT